jgi:acylphosphatase
MSAADPAGSGQGTRPGEGPGRGAPPGPQTAPTPVRVRVFVDGRVQGVGFRQSAAREAIGLGLQGWVRNLPDGRVEAVYEGTRAAVEDMIAWSRRGPGWAVVMDLTVREEEPQGERGFSIR